MNLAPTPIVLPVGPFAALLAHAHGIVQTYNHLAPDVVTDAAVAVHGHAVRQVANATSSATTYPRPEYKMGDDRVEGWNLLLLGAEEPREVLCGWHADGSFHQWAPTETIANSVRELLLDNVLRGHHD